MSQQQLIQKLTQLEAEHSTGNRLSMTSLDFRTRFGAAILRADQLRDATLTLCSDYEALFHPWLLASVEEVALEMVEPMRRLHRWERHQDIAELRSDLKQWFWAKRQWYLRPWQRVTVVTPRRRHVLRVQTLATLRESARISVLENARKAARGMLHEALMGWDDDSVRNYRQRYEGGYFYSRSDIPEDVSMQSANFPRRIGKVLARLDNKSKMNELRCIKESKLLDEAKTVLSALAHVSDSAVLHFPVSFINDLGTLSTLVNQKFVDAVRHMRRRSVELFNTTLEIPMAVKWMLPKEAT